MPLMDPTLLKYKDYYSVFGITKEDVVSASLTYRGWAPFGALTSEPKWLIQRESTVGDVTTIENVDDGDIDNIWDNRASLFDDIPFSNENSLYFDGVNDYVDFGAPALLTKERTDSWSWSFWIKPRIITGNMTLYSKRTSASTAGISIFSATGAIVVEIANTSTLKIAGRTSPLVPGTWYNLIVTYSGNSLLSGLKVYLNGVLQTLGSTTDALGTNSIATASNAILGTNGLGTQFFDGHIDEVSFWNNYVLSQSEVLEVWNDMSGHGNPGDLSLMATYANCTCWWRCGDSAQDANPVLKDIKGVLNGTMTNMVAGNFVGVVP